MIQHLAGVVEDSSIGSGGNDFFYRFAFIFCSGHKAIQIIYICLQMFSVMEIYRLLTDYRFQRIVCVRKFRHFMCHNHYC